jgi:hypothetical protein
MMPTNTTPDEAPTIEELQEALKRDTFGAPPQDQDELEPGAQEFYEEEEQVEVGEGREPEPEKEVQPEKEVPPDAETDVASESKEKVLSEEELANLLVKAKVNGKEVTYTWKELRDIKQTQDAAQEFLERAKREFKEEREAYRKQMEQQKPQADEEYLTDEEKRARQLEQKIQELERHQRSFEEMSLTEAEERHMLTVLERDGFSKEEGANRLKQIVEAYPDARIFAQDLFTKNPSGKEDLDRRIKTFNTLWQLGKTIEMPEVVRKTAEVAREQGKTEAKKEAKRNLADVSPGSADLREPGKQDKLKKLIKGDDSDFAQFMLENSVVLKDF